MKSAAFPLTITDQGISVKIRKYSQKKGETQYTSYMVDYYLLGQRKQKRFSDLTLAKAFAYDICQKIALGEQHSLALKNGDRLAYLRAIEALSGTQVPIDTACREYSHAIALLGNAGSLAEAVRFFVKAQASKIPRVNVSAAVDEMIVQATRDGKSEERVHQLETYLNRLRTAFNCDLTEFTSRSLSDFISAMPVKERTKKNCRAVLNTFFRWCVGRGYLPRDQDLMEHVQQYSGRKTGAIQIFTPEEVKALIKSADDRLRPYIVIQAFAGIRGKEIQRLDWSNIDLEDGFIEVSSDAAKTDVRRLVPIKPNLKAWLAPVAKPFGPVCQFKNLYNQIVDLATASGVRWKKNALRHSYISYRVAECADVPRVADESGNSPAIIRTNYLRRVKPAQALAWFNIAPKEPAQEAESSVEIRAAA